MNVLILFVHLLRDEAGDFREVLLVVLVDDADDPAVVRVDVGQPHRVLLLARLPRPKGHEAVDLHLAPAAAPRARAHVRTGVALLRLTWYDGYG